MEKIGGEQQGQSSSIRQVMLAAFIGTTIEWYDFVIYGTAAAIVFNQLFFPSFDPLVGTLAAFSTFAVGFIARPIGGIVFGHFGDKIGRKTMLVMSLLLMGGATFLVGLLPTYATIGVWAPILLVTFRFMQGIAVGGEWGGAVLLAVEYAPDNRRGLFGSLPQMGGSAGLLLATGVFAIFAALPDEQFIAWGWRVPFLLSIILVAFGLFIRLRIMETPAFAEVKETGTEARFPILDVLRLHPKNVLLAGGALLSNYGAFYIITTFMLAYIPSQVGLSRSVVLNGVLIVAALDLIAVPIFAALSDRLGRRPVYAAGAAGTLLFAFPLFWLVNTGQTLLVYLGMGIAIVIHSAMFGPAAALCAELFGTKVRYSGASLGYQIAAVVGGGFTPLIATALLAWASGAAWPVALYLIAMTLITLTAIYLVNETVGSNIRESTPSTPQSATSK